MASIQTQVFANRQPNRPLLAAYGFKDSGADWADATLWSACCN